MTGAVHAGWYLVAFANEVTADLTSVRLGDRRLMLVRGSDSQLTLADAVCPHRGADLTVGGCLTGGRVTCPFHGRRIAIGGEGPWRVATYPTVQVAGLVLASVDPRASTPGDLAGLVAALDGRTVVPAVNRTIVVPANYIAENAFDVDHFAAVHHVPRVERGDVAVDGEGHLVATNTFLTVSDPWGSAQSRDYLRALLGPDAARAATSATVVCATAYSPTLVATSLTGACDDTLIVTGAMPTPDGTTVRVAVAGAPGSALERAAQGARVAIDQDTPIWEAIDPRAPSRMDGRDVAAAAFQQFCGTFPTAPPSGAVEAAWAGAL